MILFAVCGAACNNTNRRTADDSVEQAQGVNDTTAMVNEKDGDFAVKAADAGLAEVELGKLAQEKATDPRVKDFAQMMVNDHQKANDELMTIATRHNITLPPVISKDQADKQRKLREKSGAEFDKEYIDMMVKDHNKVVSLFEDASSDAQNADLKAFASKTLPILKKHHEDATAIRDSISPMDTTTIQRVLP
ncbi:putative membrane protein [Parapedobacter indicus]|uniref:Putative membrane protein n=2 Tax=Parapedobacter indicus TaxID=1477437 RepID=A0A1I3UU97_9SPHI|nr:putative membrane protein [Parapedobacter indicus]SFJ86229.1 putative membrane protein [Parapedobacter indicus]